MGADVFAIGLLRAVAAASEESPFGDGWVTSVLVNERAQVLAQALGQYLRGLRTEGWVESSPRRGLQVLLWRLTPSGERELREYCEPVLCSRCGRFPAAERLGLSICGLCAGLAGPLTEEGKRVLGS